MRPILKYGVPAAAGLATGGYALSQGEDPGSAALAGLGGAAGGVAGLLGARGLAGKYAPAMYKGGLSAKQSFDTGLLQQIVQAETRRQAEGYPMSLAEKGMRGVLSRSANLPIPQESQVQRGLGKALAAGLVPVSAGIAGLGGVALGAIPGSMGIPGFQQNVITDPEYPGSSNTSMARASTPTLRYLG
jgi:hypothetical protein